MLFNSVSFFVCNIIIFNVKSVPVEIIDYSAPDMCDYDEYFNSDLLRCEKCDASKFWKPSKDKMQCQCNETTSKELGLTNSKCTPCPFNSVQSSDSFSCSSCPNGTTTILNTTVCKQCRSNEILQGRHPNGTLMTKMLCIPCENGTVPSEDKTRCIPCPIVNPAVFKGAIKSCGCPFKHLLYENICVPSSAFGDYPHKRGTFMLSHSSGDRVESMLLRRYLRPSLYLCSLKNRTACQALANLCTLTLYDEKLPSPCRVWFDYQRSSFGPVLPFLFYGDGEAVAVLSRKKIAAKYSLDRSSGENMLNLTAVVFNTNGKLKRVSPLKGSHLNLCPGPKYKFDEALRFGVNYKHSCRVQISQLMSGRETEFIVPYLQYSEGAKTRMYPVPVLIRNLEHNSDDDVSNWQLVQRFYLVDDISFLEMGKNETSIIRYVKSLEIKIKARSEEEGKIYPPLLIIKYSEIGRDSIDRDDMVQLSFIVKYTMENNIKHAIEIAIGVLSGLAVLRSGIQTWSHSRRSGKIAIDLSTALKLCLFSCENLSNAFFVVAAGVALHTFIFYKGQEVVYILLPEGNVEKIIKNYIIVAFSLKVVQMCHLLWEQTNVDLFLIDWERPRPKNSIPRPATSIKSAQVYDEQPVSVWRTYFIANEWNEIQGKRKINVLVHSVLLLVCLEILGLQYWATVDPELHLSPPDSLGENPFNLICVFAVGSLVYMILYLIQLSFAIGIYERFINSPVQDFVDICSLANISVFVLSLERFGYYVHGRSAHGFADTDMATMLTQLKKEENDLCAHRGLLQGTDQQTFSVSVPPLFRSYYRKLMTPITSGPFASIRSMGLGGFREKERMESEYLDKVIQAYGNVNKFLLAFFEHALRDIDYEIRSKLYVESLLDIEFTDCTDKAVLYPDKGHAFDSVLFYGNEFALFSFDIVLFSFTLMLSENYLLAVLVTVTMAKILCTLRYLAGRRNLAKKTLIDSRFLI